MALDSSVGDPLFGNAKVAAEKKKKAAAECRRRT